jgi:two-component system chemotaxis sensor kinase CheA
VLVRVDDHEFGLVVDGARTADTVGETASLSTIVVKPIGSMLAQLGIYSGATVLGDGGVVLILDLRGLQRIARLPPVDREPDVAVVPTAEVADRYLVCGTGAGRRVAVPLAEVVRLEQYARDQVQVVGDRAVVRRGDRFTPLADVDALLGRSAGLSEASVNVVVIDGGDGGVGLAVGTILDVLAADSPMQPGSGTGVAGILSLGGVATEIVDLRAVRRHAVLEA